MGRNRVLIGSTIMVLIAFFVAAVCTNKAVTVIAENKVASPQRIIVIDAGHGGEDGGATSCSGVLESKINLEIAMKLKDLLNFMGYKTVMVRSDDASVHTEGNTIAQRKVSDLKNRAQIVNDTENALLLSIHQNYFTDSRYRGAQVFAADSEGSHQLADMIQTAFRSTINQGSNRMAKDAGNIYLLEKINGDGVLIECGFLSNNQEEALLRDSEYQKKICSVIASAVSVYLQDKSLLT